MTYQTAAIRQDDITLPKLPAWVTVRSGETPQNVAFLSGASFAMLDMIIYQSGDSIPKDLLKNTLAMRAAVATSKLEGRMARETDIRDAYYLTPPDEEGVRHWGPDGDVLAFWRDATELRLGSKTWQAKLEALLTPNLAEQIDDWMVPAREDRNTLSPTAAAGKMLQRVLKADDRAERVACLLADVVQAKSFGWEHPLPLTALHISKAMLRDVRDEAVESEVAIQTAIAKSAQTTFRLANQLAERAHALRALAPKLRTRGSDDAVALFLSEDAVAPSGMLSPTIKGTSTKMTGRAARRLCDRLVELSVVKELTGRSTFRLYGVAP